MAVTYVNNYTSTTDISNITTNNTNTASAVTTATNDTLGKDAFLKLLIAELSNQDPTNPMDDREFISQMATFSSLEQMQNMNKTLEGMADTNKYNAINYIGKAVAFTKGEGADAQQVAAIVNNVWFDPNGIVLDTTEGEVNLEDVEGVSEIG